MHLLPLERLGITNVQKNLHKSIRFINKKLDEGIKLYQSIDKITIKTKKYPEGHVFPSGTIVFNDAKNIYEDITIDYFADAEFEKNRSKFRQLLKPNNIGLYSGLNTADFCLNPYTAILQDTGFNFKYLSDEDIRNGRLNDVDLLIVPGGPDAGESYYQGLGEMGFNEIINFVKNGGKYLGSCAGAYLPLTAEPDSDEHRMWLNIVNAGDNSGLNYWRTGSGFVRISIDVNNGITYGINYGIQCTMDVIYWEGPIFEVKSDNIKIVATYKEFIASGSNLPTWDINNNNSAKELIKWYNPLNNDRFEKYMKDKPAAIYTDYGEGKLILFSFHPEFGYPNSEFQNDIIHLFIVNSIYELFS